MAFHPLTGASSHGGGLHSSYRQRRGVPQFCNGLLRIP
jgi:hypothetical protein